MLDSLFSSIDSLFPDSWATGLWLAIALGILWLALVWFALRWVLRKISRMEALAIQEAQEQLEEARAAQRTFVEDDF